MPRRLPFVAFAFAFAAASASAQTPPRFEIEGNALVLPGPVAFEAGTDRLAPEATAALEHAKAYLAAKDYISAVRVEAHVAGADAQKLSERRALAVARWLVGNGVDCRRLLPVGFGDTKPVADGSTPEGRARNTRVAFVNAALRGRPIGGLPLDGGGAVAGDPCK